MQTRLPFYRASTPDTGLAVRLQTNGELRLIVRQGEQAGREYKILQPMVVGRDAAADIQINDPLINARHARIVKDGGYWKIIDLKSENGTFLNDRLIDKSPLYPDSEVTIGNTRLSVSYSEGTVLETALVKRSGEWVQLPRIIAHELNNYLQFFDAGIEQLRQDTDVSQRFGSEISSLQMAGDRMEDLVRMLRAGCAEPRMTDIDLVEIIWNQVAVMESAIQQAGVLLKVDVPEMPIRIMGDPQQLGSCILNVMKNALEASVKGGSIVVSIPAVTDHRLRLIIRDTGQGMDTDTLASMWTPMFTTRADGNGLGAFIAKTVITRHNGTISAHSEKGKGTEICIELPRFPA